MKYIALILIIGLLCPVLFMQESEDFSDRFSFGNALMCIDYVRDALQSFTTLTTRTKKSPQLLKDLEYIQSDIQLIGFINWANSIEGTLRAQQLEIKRLNYELAKTLFADKKIEQCEFLKQKHEYDDELKAFDSFKKNFTVVD